MSRIERILQAIIDGTSYNEAPQSRIEEILLAIKNNTDYLKLPYSRIETLLLAIKDNGDYSDLLQSRIEEILEYKLHDAVYEKDALSRIEKLLIDWIGKADYYELIGIPPLTFVSNGENLVDYRIDGASGGVGDRTENLFDKNSESVAGFINDRGAIATISDYPISTYDYINVLPNTYYSYKAFVAVNPNESAHKTIRVSYYTSNKAFISRYFEIGNGLTKKTIRTPNNCFYVRLSIDDNLENVMLWEDSSEVSVYEPYGYKIPIVCGGTTTNIYLNEPLRENESISMSDTGVSIPTINGTNILTVDTAVQPSNVYLKYKGG